MHQLQEITCYQGQCNLERAMCSKIVQDSTTIARDVANMAMLQNTTRPICKNNKAKPQKSLLLDAFAYITFLESPSLQIKLKIG